MHTDKERENAAVSQLKSKAFLLFLSCSVFTGYGHGCGNLASYRIVYPHVIFSIKYLYSVVTSLLLQFFLIVTFNSKVHEHRLKDFFCHEALQKKILTQSVHTLQSIHSDFTTICLSFRASDKYKMLVICIISYI